MFALFFERSDGTREFITNCDSRAFAVSMGKLLSRDEQDSIIGVENTAAGTTVICCRFRGGVLLPDPAGRADADA